MKKASSPAPISLSQEMDKHQHENQEAVGMHHLAPDTTIYREGENMDCSQEVRTVKDRADSLFKFPIQTKAKGGEPLEWIPIKFQLIPPECPHSNEEKSELFKTIKLAGGTVISQEAVDADLSGTVRILNEEYFVENEEEDYLVPLDTYSSAFIFRCISHKARGLPSPHSWKYIIPNNTSKYLPYDAFTTIRQKMGWKSLHKLHFIPNDRRITARQWIEDLRRKEAALRVAHSTNCPVSATFTPKTAVERVNTARKLTPASTAAEKELLLPLPSNAQARDPESFSSSFPSRSCRSEKLGKGGVEDATAAAKTSVSLQDSQPAVYTPSQSLTSSKADRPCPKRCNSSPVESAILSSVSAGTPSTLISQSRAVSLSPSTASTVVVAVRPPLRTRFYTTEEDQRLLDLICKHKAFRYVHGNKFWKLVEGSKKFESRTYQSLKNHFLKIIIPKVISKKKHGYKLSSEDRIKLKKGFDNKNKKFFNVCPDIEL